MIAPFLLIQGSYFQVPGPIRASGLAIEEYVSGNARGMASSQSRKPGRPAERLLRSDVGVAAIRAGLSGLR